MKQLFSPRVMTILLAAVAFIGIAGGVFFYLQYQKAQSMLTNASNSGQQEVTMVVGKVGKLMVLPKDEVPTLATVADITKLKGQPFFENAKNGFKVLIYTKAKEAILYDPIADKIVEVAPVNIGNNQGAATPTPTQIEQKEVVPQTTQIPLPTK